MPKTAMTVILSMVFLSVSSCAGGFQGNFCDLAFRMEVKNEASAVYLLRNERDLLIDMNVHNRTIDRRCT